VRRGGRGGRRIGEDGKGSGRTGEGGREEGGETGSSDLMEVIPLSLTALDAAARASLFSIRSLLYLVRDFTCGAGGKQAW